METLESICHALASADLVLSETSDAVRIIDEGYTIRYANRAFCQLFSPALSSATGKKCYELTPSSKCHTPECHLRQAQSHKERTEIEADCPTTDGRFIRCRITTVPILSQDGSVSGIIEIRKDLSPLRRMSTALAESEERYRSLVELSGEVGEAIVMLQDIEQGEGIQTYVSNEWCHITGYTKEELVGKCFFSLVDPTDEAVARERHRLKMSGKSLPGLFELNIIRKDGTTIPVELTSALSYYRGQPANVAYIRDIAQRKKMQQDLLSYQKHLEQMVMERTHELEEAKQNLEKEIASRAQFMRAIAHELKTPLTPMISASEVLLEELRDHHLATLARSIFHGSHRLNRRVDELLDLARGEVGLLELNCSWVDIKSLLEEISDYIGSNAPDTQGRLVLELPDRLPPVWGDEERLEQVVLNLLSNAFKYSPEGSPVVVKAYEGDGMVTVEVEDRGPGISPEEQKRLFQPYQRLQSHQTDGLGMGLALSKRFVELHQGKIYAKSGPGRGSIFGFSLPLGKR